MSSTRHSDQFKSEAVRQVTDRGFKQVVGWVLRGKADTDMVVQALLTGVWRCKPKTGVLVHSDQGSVYTSDDSSKFLEAHGLMLSMSRRGN